VLKKIIIILAVILGAIIVSFLLMNEPLPKGKQGPDAEIMADQILKNLNKEAWDSLEAIQWSYPIGHQYIWDKKRNLVEVKWSDYKVLLNPDSGKGKAYENDVVIEEGEGKIISKALSYFFNDSFWLIAPYKIKDQGTIRSIVEYEGKSALLVQYTTGGSTPGDSYLWIVDENYRPIAWKFWVSIIPIGGLEYSWEKWEERNNAWISIYHEGIMDISIDDLKVANTAAELNGGIDPFANF
jgi:hypothetical protein